MLKTQGAVATLLLVLTGCTPVRSTPATRYLGMLVNARDLGAEALRLEAQRDPGVRDYLARAGEPDFILVASANDVELVYVQSSRLVHFHRAAPDAPGVPTEVVPLPSPLLHLLPRDLRAGTPRPLEGTDVGCWTVVTSAGPCRTCCATAQSCVVDCPQDASTVTPRQKAT